MTGGTGFLGSHLVRSYLKSGAHVRAISRRGAWDGDRPRGVELVKLDLRYLDGSELFQGVDLVIHAAGATHGGRDARPLLQEMNVEVTRRIINACRDGNVPRLLHVSSTAAIGISPDPSRPADEGFRFNLEHLELPYNETKREAEKLVLDADGSHVRTIVVNPGYVFGSYRGSFRGREVIERVLRRPLVVCTGGGLSIVHVDDVVDGIRKVLDRGRPGHRYILSGDNVSFCEIARTVGRIAGRPTTVVRVPDAIRDLAGRLMRLRSSRSQTSDHRLYLDRRSAYAYYSSDVARAELGYAPRSFAAIAREGIAQMGVTSADPS